MEILGGVSGGVSGVMFVVGGVGIVVFMWVFLAGGRYRGAEGDMSPVEFGRARREAEAMVASLAPRLISLAEDEERLPGEVWEKFAVASAVVEEEPLKAIEGLEEVEAGLCGIEEASRKEKDDGAK